MTALFVVISGVAPQRKAVALVDGVNSFEVRLAMLNRLMEFEAADEVEAEMWARMARRLTRGYKKRHELAHFALITNGDAQWGVSPFMNYDKMIGETQGFLSLEKISERNRRFVVLSLAVDWFMGQAVRRRAVSAPNPPLDHATQEFLAHLREIAARTLEERRSQPKSASPADDW